MVVGACCGELLVLVMPEELDMGLPYSSMNLLTMSNAGCGLSSCIESCKHESVLVMIKMFVLTGSMLMVTEWLKGNPSQLHPVTLRPWLLLAIPVLCTSFSGFHVSCKTRFIPL